MFQVHLIVVFVNLSTFKRQNL